MKVLVFHCDLICSCITGRWRYVRQGIFRRRQKKKKKERQREVSLTDNSIHLITIVIAENSEPAFDI